MLNYLVRFSRLQVSEGRKEYRYDGRFSSGNDCIFFAEIVNVSKSTYGGRSFVLFV
jgi:hypothetical protein